MSTNGFYGSFQTNLNPGSAYRGFSNFHQPNHPKRFIPGRVISHPRAFTSESQPLLSETRISIAPIAPPTVTDIGLAPLQFKAPQSKTKKPDMATKGNEKEKEKGKGKKKGKDKPAIIDPSDFARRVFSYTAIADSNLLHCPKDREVPKTPAGDAVKFLERQTTLLLDVNERVYRSKALEILAKVELNGAISPAVIAKGTWEDLDLVAGRKKNKDTNEDYDFHVGTVMAKHASTQLGKSYLLGLIARPTDDIHTLQRRQKIIKGMIDSDLYLTNRLQEGAEGEKQLISFWDDKLQLPGSCHGHYFKMKNFVGKTLNHSTTALELSAFSTNIKKVTNAIGKIAQVTLVPAYLASQFGLFTAPLWMTHAATVVTMTAGPIFAIPALLGVAGGTAGIVASSLATAQASTEYASTAQWARADIAVEGVVQNKLVVVARFYRNFKAIYQQISENDALKNNLEHFHKLERFFANKELSKIFSVLESWTFNAPASYIFRRGNVLLAWELLQQNDTVRTAFEEALTAVAEIDAFIALAKLYKERENTSAKYSFPRYLVGQTKPTFYLKNFWNPLLDPNKAVTNTLALGQDGVAANAIYTGPNAAGKSTVLRQMINAIFAQSIGMVAAEEMAVTPFSYLGTSMNIKDNLKEDQSLFQAQTDKVVEIDATVKSVDPNSFKLLIVDELFSGTDSEGGGKLGSAAMNKWINNEKVIVMAVTHNPAMTALQSTGRVKNYQLLIDERSKMPLYKIGEGISPHRIAIDVAQRRGLDMNVIANARANTACTTQRNDTDRKD